MSANSRPIANTISALAATFSATHIGPETSEISEPFPNIDDVEGTIRDVLSPSLSGNLSHTIRRDDPCFDSAKAFARKWGISSQAVKSHISLACGCRKFPTIMLLNPSPHHEVLSYREMVQASPTLAWLEITLQQQGLGLGDVSILDMCTLLSNSRLDQLKDKRDEAVHEAYDVTWELMRAIKPHVLLLCQCSTRYPPWVNSGHFMARQLCSSMRDAREGRVRIVDVDSHEVHVVQGYHPSVFLNYSNQGQLGEELEKTLKLIFQRLYRPCGQWKQKLQCKAVSKKVINAAEGFIEAIRRVETKLNSNAYGIYGNRRPVIGPDIVPFGSLLQALKECEEVAMSLGKAIDQLEMHTLLPLERNVPILNSTSVSGADSPGATVFVASIPTRPASRSTYHEMSLGQILEAMR